MKKYRKKYEEKNREKLKKKRRLCNIHFKAMNEAIFEDYFQFIGRDLSDGTD